MKATQRHTTSLQIVKIRKRGGAYTTQRIKEKGNNEKKGKLQNTFDTRSLNKVLRGSHFTLSSPGSQEQIKVAMLT